MDKLLSIIIPVYNEEKTIKEIIERVKSVKINKEIIVVDDCSNDNTYKILEELKKYNEIKIYRHEKNSGKGAAIRTAIKHIEGEYSIIQDADLEYDPNEYEKILTPIWEDKADVVFGSRFVGSEPHRVLFFWHYIGNRFLTLLSNIFTNLNLTDMETCYKAFKSEILKSLDLKENGFGIEPEITAKVAKKNLRIYEVGISYSGRSYNEGKKIRWIDGIYAIWCIIKYNLFT